VLPRFNEIWAADFEFVARAGEIVEPVCLVAHELRSGRQLRLWAGELAALSSAPFCVDENSLFVAFFASAEMSCFLALGWPMPKNVLDLFVEFKNSLNGLPTTSDLGFSLLGALAHYGLPGIDEVDKHEMRDLIMSGGPWSDEQKVAILDYCESDVVALGKLLPRMTPTLDLDRALIRGRYMSAVAVMEHRGIPIDTHTLVRLVTHHEDLKLKIIDKLDHHRIFDGTTFKHDRFAQFLSRSNIAWPMLDTGKLALDESTFDRMAKADARIAPIHELRNYLSQLRLADLAVGKDGRNRTMLSPFRAKTARNQPSNSKFIFGPSKWIRSLIQPPPGRAIAYVDWSQQEYGIGAALSKDAAMMHAYASGDPYIAFGKQAGLIPPDGTKATHSEQRELCKACILSIQYGQGDEGLAARIGKSTSHARELLRLHREAYPTFWAWSDEAIDHAMLKGYLFTRFGWRIHVGPDANPRSLRNFPCQANGAEMMRVAAVLAAHRGIEICAPVHDAFVIESALEAIGEAVEAMKQAMSDASAAVLDGFRLRSDAVVVCHPERYGDARGREMWEAAMAALDELEPGCIAGNPKVYRR
jgi:DNA polymerase I